MDPVQSFIEVAQRYCEAVLDAPSQPVAERILALSSRAADLFAAAQHLPLVEGGARVKAVASPLTDWPGLGSFEDYWVIFESLPEERVLSEVVLGTFSAVYEGLGATDPDRAAALWRTSFDEEWGLELAAALLPLQRAAASVQASRRQRQRGQGIPRAEIVNLEAVPEGLEPVEKPFLGIRFEPVGGGVEVLAVHPEGPAAGVLRPGDFVIRVDGTALADLGHAEAGRILVGEPSEEQIFEVYRDGETLQVGLTASWRSEGSERLAQDSPQSARRVVLLQALHPEAARRATAALSVIGCEVGSHGRDLLKLSIPPHVDEADVKVLLDAGMQSGIWRPLPPE